MYYVWNDMHARFHCEVVKHGNEIAVTNTPHPFTAEEAEKYAHEIHEQFWGMQHNVRVVDAATMVDVLVLKARF